MTYDPGRLELIAQAVAGAKEWRYTDTGGETASTFLGAGWFTDAKDKGARVGDAILLNDQTNHQLYRGYFSVVQDTGNSQGTVVFDTD
jgi:hypothetical protein